nr:MAG TPA: hypothetical protein [Caudoviricetes sp.]
MKNKCNRSCLAYCPNDWSIICAEERILCFCHGSSIFRLTYAIMESVKEVRLWNSDANYQRSMI